MTFTSNDPAVFQLAAGDFTALDTVTVTVPQGQTNSFSVPFRVVGVSIGPGTLTVSAPGFEDRTTNVTARQPVLWLRGLPTSVDLLDAPDLFQVGVNVLNAAGTGFQFSLSSSARLRVLSDLVVDVASNTPSVGVIVDRFGTEVPQAVIRQGQTLTTSSSTNNDVIFFEPLNLGATDINAAAAGYDSTNPSNPQMVMVVTPTMSFQTSVSGGSGSNYITGALGVYHQGYVSLSAPAPTGGLDVTFTSNDPSVFQLAAGDFTALDTVTVTVPQGQTNSFSVPFRVVGVSIGPGTLTVSAPGFEDRTTNVTARQPVLWLRGLPTSVDLLDAPDLFQVGVNVLNAAGTGFQFSLSSSARLRVLSDLVVDVASNTPSVGVIVDRFGTEVPQAVIRQGQTLTTSSSTNNDAIFFEPTGVGTTEVQASVAGFLPWLQPINVE